MDSDFLRLARRVKQLEDVLAVTERIAGEMVLWPGGSTPDGWLLCDGAAVSRTTYAALFEAIGTAYGVGNGSTTFNLPNLKGRVAAGRDALQTEFNSMGKMGGEKTHTLTASEIPPLLININSLADGGSVGAGFVQYGSTRSGGIYGTINTDGLAHPNMPPYVVLNYIIKH